jgi:6-phosphogluconolactonase
VTEALNPAKDITSFTILGIPGTIGVNTIDLTVPYGTGLTALTPTIVITGASVNPGSGAVQDFTAPVLYTVTAADATTKDYTVTVTEALNPAKDITSFTILGIPGTIGVNTITLTVPYGTGLTALTPTIVITGASVNPASGAVQDFTAPVLYTVTAADASTKDYTVTVTEALNPAKDIISFTILGISGTIGVNTITLTVPCGTDLSSLTPTIVITGVSVDPASGAAQDFTSPVVYTVTAADATTKDYTVTVSLSLCVAYVTNSTSDNVSAYTIDDATGALTPIAGSPFAAGDNPVSVAVDPNGLFAYVANADSDNVSAYTIDDATGALTPITGSPFAAADRPRSVTVDPSGRFAYVANSFSSDISAYEIDGVTGSLTPISGSPFSAGNESCWVTVDPAGSFAYVANAVANNIWSFAIDVGTGALTPGSGSPFPTALAPRSAVVVPGGGFAYVANADSNSISGYAVDNVTGALTPISGSPFGAGSNPRCVAVDPSGGFLYAANLFSNNISAYGIDSVTGGLTPIVGSPFAAGTQPISVTADPSGRFAYVTNELSDDVWAYEIDAGTGALATIPGSPFAAEGGPLSVVTVEIE